MRIAIVMPVFNHAGTVGRVVEEVRVAAGEVVQEIVVVDDGCTDGSGEILRSLSGVTLLWHEKNQGKGRALLTGFRHARERGYTHVATIDADGQHDPADLAKVLAGAREHPEDLIIGWRDMESAGQVVPARSKKGRDAARFWLRVQTGQDIPDSQCGLRVYPLAHVLDGRVGRYRFGRFDFETEVLARMAWAGLRVRSVPVRCIYFSAAQRISHFRPIWDTVRGVRVNAFLVGRRLLPVPFRRLVGRDDDASLGGWWKWETWRAAMREVMRTGSSNAELATGFALGVFVGLTPAYFLQTILAIYFARRLHLNVLAAVIGSQISIPPLVPLWVGLSMGVGHWLLRGEWHWVPTLLLGNLLVAVTTAMACLLAARGVLYWVRTERTAG